MSTPITKLEDADENSLKILLHILETLGGLDNIKAVEATDAGLWIELKDDSTHFITIEDCEKEE